MKRTRGFTIVELLIVIVVIAILAAVVIVAYNGIQNRAKVTASQSSAQNAAKKVAAQYVIDNAYPASLADIGISNGNGVTYQYTGNTAGGGFCVTATASGASGNAGGMGSSARQPASGPCPGHTGTAPTTLDDGSSCPAGYIVVPGNSMYGTKTFCVMQFEAKNSSGSAVSQSSGTPWVSISQTSAISTASAACSGCHLITEGEWLTIAANVLSVGSNWSGSSVGSGTFPRGNSNTSAAMDGSSALSGINQRTLTLTNGEVIWDLAGNVWEWTDATMTTGQPGASGYAWREWSAAGAGSINPSPLPVTANPAGASWDGNTGIGRVYSNSDETGTRAFFRGGGWDHGSSAGVLTLSLSYAPSSTSAYIGFRVAR